jgi:hypothetical protein
MARRLIIVVAAALSAAILAAGSAADSPIFSSTVFFRITYRADCTFTVAIDGGPTMDSTVPGPTTIPPGPYQVSVRTPLPDGTWDPSACTIAEFSLTGPGVSYSATLGSDLGPYSATYNPTFAPASTYTILDGNHPSQPVVFTTTATGSSSSLLPPVPASTASGTGSTQPGLIGSGIVPYRGALTATVRASGSPTLDSHGKPLSTLKAGLYDIVVEDASRHGGFFVQKAHRKPVAIAGVSFTGKRTVRVNLTAGTWTFFSQGGKAASFVVTL